MNKTYVFIMTALFALATSGAAQSSPMVYRGINPNITPTAPYNPNILARAAIGKKEKPSSSGSSRLSEADLLKSSVISGLASQYTSLLTSNSPTATGTINFGDGQFADYSTAGGVRTITFRDTIRNTTTTITFPIA